MTFRYCYSGRVLPERACVELPPTSGEIEAPGLLRGRISIQVGCSQVIAIVDLDAELSNVALLKTGIQSLVAARVDAFGYLRALGFDVEITSCVDPHNRFTVFGVHIEALVNTETQRPVTLEDLHELRLNMPLRLALADLRLAIRYPDDMEHFAFRAIESIRQHFVESGGKPSDSWKRLRDALRIDRSWIESIKDAATARRHGETGALFISGPEQGRILETARGVIDRFCLFLKSPDAVRALPTLRIDEGPPGKVDS